MNVGCKWCGPPPGLGVRMLVFAMLLLPGWLTAQTLTARATPSTARAPLGSLVQFCIETQGGTALTYQWRKNGVSLPGETNQCLILTNIAIADGASYRAGVTGTTGACESEEADLQVLVPILSAEDAFANATSISAISNSVRGVSVIATREPGEPQHFRLSTSNSVWYSWRAPVGGIVTFDTRGSTYDTVLAVYTGGTPGTLVELASDDDGGGFHTSRVRWNAEQDRTYRVVIDGVTGETGTYVCNWLLQPTPYRLPEIVLQPRSQAVPLGGTAVFMAVATDPLPGLKYQWFRNDAPVENANNPTLTLVNVQARDLGRYRLAVTNVYQLGVLTQPADLEIGPVPEIVSRDKIAEVPEAGGGGGIGGGGGGLALSSVSGGTFSLAAGTIINQRFFVGGTTDRCEPAHCNVVGGATRWFQLSAVTDGICTIDTLNSDVDTILAVYLHVFAVCTNIYEPLVDCNNDVLGSCDQLLATNGVRQRGSRLSFFATAGSKYRAVVDTVGGARGTNIQFNVRFQASAAAPTNAVVLGTTTDALLQLRGSAVALRVDPSFAQTGSTFQWFVDGRRIAGATRDRLFLPALEYSDAGRYSVTVQTGPAQMILPGAVVLVMDPCSRDGASNRPVRLMGSSPVSFRLEATGTLGTTSSWEVVGPILPSAEPVLWDAGAGTSRFYRALSLSP